MKYQHVFICVLLLFIFLGSCYSNKVGNGESFVYSDREIKYYRATDKTFKTFKTLDKDFMQEAVLIDISEIRVVI